MGDDKLVKTCMLFDFENIEVSLRKQYKLSLTEKGFKKIIEFTKSYGSIENKNILVGAYWEHFKSQKNFITKVGAKPVYVPIDIKNSADCALIVDIMKMDKINQLDDLGAFIILSGDGGYGSLVHYLHEINKTVIMFSIKECTKPELVQLVDQHVFIEDILQIQDETKHNEEYTIRIDFKPEWKAVVIKVHNLRHMYQLDEVYLIKQLVNASSKHTDLVAYDNFDKCKQLVRDCYLHNILIPDKRTTQDGKVVNTVKLNMENVNVEALFSNLC